MEDLANEKCVPCEGGIPAFDIKEVHKYLKKIEQLLWLQSWFNYVYGPVLHTT